MLSQLHLINTAPSFVWFPFKMFLECMVADKIFPEKQTNSFSRIIEHSGLDYKMPHLQLFTMK